MYQSTSNSNNKLLQNWASVQTSVVDSKQRSSRPGPATILGGERGQGNMLLIRFSFFI